MYCPKSFQVGECKSSGEQLGVCVFILYFIIFDIQVLSFNSWQIWVYIILISWLLKGQV